MPDVSLEDLKAAYRKESPGKSRDRLQAAVGRKKGKSESAIAAQLGRSQGVISERFNRLQSAAAMMMWLVDGLTCHIRVVQQATVRGIGGQI